MMTDYDRWKKQANILIILLAVAGGATIVFGLII